MLILTSIVLSLIVAVGAAIYFDKDDGKVEEAAEEVLDRSLEAALHVPEGSIDIDVTPHSREDKEAGG